MKEEPYCTGTYRTSVGKFVNVSHQTLSNRDFAFKVFHNLRARVRELKALHEFYSEEVIYPIISQDCPICQKNCVKNARDLA